MEWLGPKVIHDLERKRWPVLLSVCPNLDRMQSREHALVSAGYQQVSVSTLEAARELSQHCKFDILLLDQECACEDDANRLQETLVSVVLARNTSERQLLAQLGHLLHAASASASIN